MFRVCGEGRLVRIIDLILITTGYTATYRESRTRRGNAPEYPLSTEEGNSQINYPRVCPSVTIPYGSSLPVKIPSVPAHHYHQNNPSETRRYTRVMSEMAMMDASRVSIEEGLAFIIIYTSC